MRNEEIKRYDNEPSEPILKYNKEELDSFNSIFTAFDKSNTGYINKQGLLKIFDTL